MTVGTVGSPASRLGIVVEPPADAGEHGWGCASHRLDVLRFGYSTTPTTWICSTSRPATRAHVSVRLSHLESDADLVSTAPSPTQPVPGRAARFPIGVARRWSPPPGDEGFGLQQDRPSCHRRPDLDDVIGGTRRRQSSDLRTAIDEAAKPTASNWSRCVRTSGCRAPCRTCCGSVPNLPTPITPGSASRTARPTLALRDRCPTSPRSRPASARSSSPTSSGSVIVSVHRRRRRPGRARRAVGRGRGPRHGAARRGQRHLQAEYSTGTAIRATSTTRTTVVAPIVGPRRPDPARRQRRRHRRASAARHRRSSPAVTTSCPWRASLTRRVSATKRPTPTASRPTPRSRGIHDRTHPLGQPVRRRRPDQTH